MDDEIDGQQLVRDLLDQELRQDFNNGRTGRSARRIESTLSCQAASERFKTTIEAHHREELQALQLSAWSPTR